MEWLFPPLESAREEEEDSLIAKDRPQFPLPADETWRLLWSFSVLACVAIVGVLDVLCIVSLRSGSRQNAPFLWPLHCCSHLGLLGNIQNPANLKLSVVQLPGWELWQAGYGGSHRAPPAGRHGTGELPDLRRHLRGATRGWASSTAMMITIIIIMMTMTMRRRRMIGRALYPMAMVRQCFPTTYTHAN
jgi:hypothetical protein